MIYGIGKRIFGWIGKPRNGYSDKWKAILYLNCVLFHALWFHATSSLQPVTLGYASYNCHQDIDAQGEMNI